MKYKFIKHFFYALNFLTIIPLPCKKQELSIEELSKSSIFFPLVGFIKGILIISLFFLLKNVFSIKVLSFMLVLFHLSIDGGFHLDGLSDTFDAIASRASKERKLQIMKESTVGPIGVVAIVMVILLKYLLIYDCLEKGHIIGVFLFSVASESAVVSAIFIGKSAKNEGLGNIFITYTGIKEFIFSMFITLIIFCLSYILLSQQIKIFISLLLTIVFAIFLTKLFTNLFGGLTGDTLGALCELSEILFLIFILYFKNW